MEETRTEKKNDNGFIKLLFRIKHSNTLSRFRGGPWTVYTAIALHINSKGAAWPSIPEIANLTGYSEKQVKRLVKKLVDGGMVQVHPEKTTGKYPHNVYVLNPAFVRYGMNDADRAAKRNLDAFRKQRAEQTGITTENLTNPEGYQSEPAKRRYAEDY